jgi:hypothetical protein
MGGEAAKRRVHGGVELTGVWTERRWHSRSGVGETAKERGERFAGVLVVLVRAKDRALRCCSEPSMVAARWLPAVVF